MQKKDQPTYCVQCEDPGNYILYLRVCFNNLDFNLKFNHIDCQKFMNAHFKSTLSEVVPEVMKQEPVNVALSNKPLSLPVPIEYTPNGNFSATLEALNAKINWASNELRNSHIVKYNIELCEMIKAASEAMIALKRV